MDLPPLRTGFRNRKESAVTSVACIVFAPFSLAGEPRACPLLYSTLIYIVPIGFSVCLLFNFKGSKLRERERVRERERELYCLRHSLSQGSRGERQRAEDHMVPLFLGM